MTRAYTPNPGSVVTRVIEFFIRNPDEELTAADVEAKLGLAKKSAAPTLGPAVRAGLLGWQVGRGKKSNLGFYFKATE